MFKLGEVRVPDDQDFDYIKQLALNNQDWTLAYEKSNTKVWTKRNELSSFCMLKMRIECPDISASVFYDVIHDADYRTHWDDNMLEGFEICYVAPNSDIGYYAAKLPKPLRNRDFVAQRCWIDYGESGDKIIFNHSINHAKHPVRKNFIRGTSYLTAYYISPVSKTSCYGYYITQSDPGGSLPAWVVNGTSKVLAPKFSKKIYKAASKYEKWKLKQKNPNFKPWLYPEQINVPKIDWNDILPWDASLLRNDSVDESQIKENEYDKNDLNNDQDDD